jgi:hypothetical protein
LARGTRPGRVAPAGLPGVQGLDEVGVFVPRSPGVSVSWWGDLVAAGLPGDRQDGEPLDLLDPEQLAIGGLDCQAPGMMLRIVESSHFTAYNAGEFCLGDGAR